MMREEGSRKTLNAQVHVIGTAKSVPKIEPVVAKPAGKAEGSVRIIKSNKEIKRLTKKEKKDLYKAFTELIQEHSDETGYWEPTAYHVGMWKAEEILKKLLEEW